jgi:hypothetical protein
MMERIIAAVHLLLLFNPSTDYKTVLLRQDHLFDRFEVAGLHFVKVDTAWNRVAIIIGCVPGGIVNTGVHVTVNQGAHFLAKRVVDLNKWFIRLMLT